MNTTLTKTSSKARRIGMHRAYVYRLDTREEIAEFAWIGSSENAIRDGVRYVDTALSIDVVDLETREIHRLTADAFPFPVAVKTWHGDAVPAEWRKLVSRGDGWQGNEADRAGVTRGRLGR